MGVINFCGAEIQDTSEFYTSGGTAFTIETTIKRNGAASYRLTPVTTGVMWFHLGVHGADGTKGYGSVVNSYFRMYIYIVTKPTAEEYIGRVGYNGGGKLSIKMNSSGNLIACDQAGSTLATGSLALSTGTWYRIEGLCGTGTSANYEIRIDGNTEVSGTGNLSATNAGCFTIGKTSNTNGSGFDICYDDICWRDDTWCGPGSVRELLPDGESATYNSWTASAGTKLSCVIERPANTTDYVTTSTNNAAQAFTLDSCANSDITSDSISAVKPYSRIIRTGSTANAVKIRLRSGSTDSDTTGFDTTSYVLLGKVLVLDPADSGAWTRTKLDALEVGSVSGAAKAVRGTIYGVVVEYNPSTNVSITGVAGAGTANSTTPVVSTTRYVSITGVAGTASTNTRTHVVSTGVDVSVTGVVGSANTNTRTHTVTVSTNKTIVAVASTSTARVMYPHLGTASVYFIDYTGGSDTNGGLSAYDAWKTISKVNGSTFTAGQSILFKSGETWRELLTIPSAGTSTDPLTFGSYGTGNLPKLKASDLISSWSIDSGNIWKATIATVCNIVTFDEVRGIKQASKVACTANTHWYHDGATTLYVYSSGGNPSTVYTTYGVEAGARDRAISFDDNDYVVVENLELSGSNVTSATDGILSINGLVGAEYGTVRGVVIKNCNMNGVIIRNAGHCIIEDCTITYCGRHAIYGYEGSLSPGCDYNIYRNNLIHDCAAYGVSIYGYSATDRSSYNEVYGNTIYNTGDAVYANWGDHNLIHNNVLYNNTDQTSIGEGYGVGIQTGSFNEVYLNEMYGNRTRSVEIWGGTTPYGDSNSNKVYRNYIHDTATGYSEGAGIFFSSAYSDDTEIYSNILIGNRRGIYMTSANNTGNLIYNNVILDSVTIGIHVAAAMSGYTIKNNILSGNTTYGLSVAAGSTITHTNNCYYKTANGNVVSDGGTTYTPSTVTNYEATAVGSDPLLVSSSDWHLQTSSPCKNAGANLGSYTDYYGVAFGTYGGAWDIGASETLEDVALTPTVGTAVTNTRTHTVVAVKNISITGVVGTSTANSRTPTVATTSNISVTGVVGTSTGDSGVHTVTTTRIVSLTGVVGTSTANSSTHTIGIEAISTVGTVTANATTPTVLATTTVSLTGVVSTATAGSTTHTVVAIKNISESSVVGTATANTSTVTIVATKVISITGVVAVALTNTTTHTVSAIRNVSVSSTVANCTADSRTPLVSTGVNISLTSVVGTATSSTTTHSVVATKVVGLTGVVGTAIASTTTPSVSAGVYIFLTTTNGAAVSNSGTHSVVAIRNVTQTQTTGQATADSSIPSVSAGGSVSLTSSVGTSTANSRTHTVSGSNLVTVTVGTVVTNTRTHNVVVGTGNSISETSGTATTNTRTHTVSVTLGILIDGVVGNAITSTLAPLVVATKNISVTSITGTSITDTRTHVVIGHVGITGIVGTATTDTRTHTVSTSTGILITSTVGTALTGTRTVVVSGTGVVVSTVGNVVTNITSPTAVVGSGVTSTTGIATANSTTCVVSAIKNVSVVGVVGNVVTGIRTPIVVTSVNKSISSVCGTATGSSSTPVVGLVLIPTSGIASTVNKNHSIYYDKNFSVIKGIATANQQSHTLEVVGAQFNEVLVVQGVVSTVLYTESKYPFRAYPYVVKRSRISLAIKLYNH